MKLRKAPRLLLAALLAFQLVAGAPLQAQPLAKSPDAPVAASPAMAAHCAGHATEQAQGTDIGHVAATHHGAGGHDKACCGDEGCATGHCSSHCVGAQASAPVAFVTLQSQPAERAPASRAGPRVARRSFGFFRPPI